jgi:hypothetical protein
MKNGRLTLIGSLLVLALACPFGSCATSAPVTGETGGSTGSGGTTASGGSGGSTGSGGNIGSTGGNHGSGGNGSGGQSASGSGGSGCGGKGSGAGGQAGNSNFGVDGGGASPYANFATIQQIVQLKCGGSSCHNSGLQNPMFQDDSNLYSALTTDKAPDCMNYLLVKAGAPSQSAMYLAISGACPCVPQMPNGCMGGDPNGPEYSCLPPDYIEGVRQWIANGAPQQ